MCLSVAGCSALGKKAEDKTKDWSAEQLYAEAKQARLNGDYPAAIDYYQKLVSRYPFGPFAKQAQIDIAYAYYKNDEPASAIAAADRFIQLYPLDAGTDYAYYLKGLTHFHQGKGLLDRYLPLDASARDQEAALQAFRDFNELLERFPDSNYAQDARQRMLYLRDNLARHEIHIANFYLKRGAYVAALNRAKYVLENYQQTTAVADALTIQVKAYKLLALEDLAADTLRVLKLNYPDHPDIAEVETLTPEN